MARASAASAEDLQRWKALGGTWEDLPAKKGAKAAADKLFIAPSGDKLKTWNDALKILQESENNKKDVEMKDTKNEDKSAKRPKKAAAESKKAKAEEDDEAKESDKENAPGAKSSKKAKKSAAKKEEEPKEEEQPAVKDEATGLPIGSGRRAAQVQKSYKDEGPRVGGRNDRVTVADEIVAASETEALAETNEPAGIKRRLFDFSIVDEQGVVQPLERLALMQGSGSSSSSSSAAALFFSGFVQPAEGEASREKGRRLARSGGLKEWKTAYSADGFKVLLRTAHGLYECVKPSTAYRKLWSPLEEQLEICAQVYQALCPAVGGAYTASLEEVVARMARAKVGRNYPNAREALLLNGRFVTSQLEVMAAQHGANAGNGKSTATTFTNCAFATSLAAELAKGPIAVGPGAMAMGGANAGIKIGEAVDAAPAGPSGAHEEADEEFARRLQAKMDAEALQGRGNGRGRGGAPQPATAYIQVREEEIADDYPLPAQYDKDCGEEMDELLMADEELLGAAIDTEALPKRLLNNFALYNSEGFFSSLELLPMMAGIETEMEIYASGNVAEDEGDYLAGAQPMEGEVNVAAAPGAEAGAAGSGAGSSSADDKPAANTDSSMRIYLSAIREWTVECSCDMLFLTIRTDVAWYRLTTPHAKYAPWFRTVVRCAQLGVKVAQMLQAESRASKLSFNDVAKRLAEQAETSPTFISRRFDAVERFLVVHGQIFLSQLAQWPNKAVSKSAFASQLKERMQTRRHCKLYMSKVRKALGAKARNNNPMRNRAASAGRPKPMPATATTMVKAVWSGYFFVGAEADQVLQANRLLAEARAGGKAAKELEVAKEVEEDENEDEGEGDAKETALAEGRASRAAARGAGGKRKAKGQGSKKFEWVGEGKTDVAGRTLFAGAKFSGMEVKPGSLVAFDGEEDDVAEATAEANPLAAANEEGPGGVLGLVQCLFEDGEGERMVQVRLMVRGMDTVLGDTAGEWELFVCEDLVTRPLAELRSVLTARRLDRPNGAEHRLKNFQEDQALNKANVEARASGKPVTYVYRTLYRPNHGMFRTLEADLGLGAYKVPEPETIALGLSDTGALIKAGVTYNIGDFCYLHPAAFGEDEEVDGGDAMDEDEDEEATESDEDFDDGKKKGAKKGGKKAAAGGNKKGGNSAGTRGKHKGSNEGLKAFALGQVVAVNTRAAGKDGKVPVSIKVRRFYRPEDVSPDHAYKAEWWDVFAGAGAKSTATVDVADIYGKCAVTLGRRPTNPEIDTFVCVGTFDPAKAGTTTAKPASLAVDAADAKAGAPAKGKAAAKGKGKAAASEAEAMDVDSGAGSSGAAAEAEERDEPAPTPMATMDIFAGCGGLSEGMHQAGVADTKWAVEYEAPAAEAFQKNNPEAKVFCNNCNVLLRAAMAKAGLADDCDACEDALAAAAQLSPEDMAALPLPGEVEFIMGGPPCQGYSGMNRFNKGNWSMVQNSMVMAFLSYCDFYRPRYFMLENVRNFVSHNKSFTFRLTLRTLLEMGYQVRFGVLNAGNFGVPQSRKRTIIWAAAPTEKLPEWPKPRHVFLSPQLTINLPGGVAYTAVPNLPGAPLRAVTVKDAIMDLPPIPNGHSKEVMDYDRPPTSAFQKFIRGRATQLLDHISKDMNELNLERCRCIPKNTPGADWRVLQEIVKNDPSRELYKGQPLVPWCLPNTADRHNGWRGLFGRVDPNGHFPTSTTDPQPMGKVGQVFHPDQDRIVSVRECARSQGFPDHFQFAGNIHNKHRQVGNAVPPPLSHALGCQLRRVLVANQTTAVDDALAAQRAALAAAKAAKKAAAAAAAAAAKA